MVTGYALIVSDKNDFYSPVVYRFDRRTGSYEFELRHDLSEKTLDVIINAQVEISNAKPSIVPEAHLKTIEQSLKNG